MTHPLFLFGTLRHAPLFEIVAGVPLAGQKAALADHAVYGVKDQAFPILVGAKGARAEGILVSGLDDEALARLDFYETIFSYDRHSITVMVENEEVTADVYLPPSGQWEAGPLWSLEDWAEEHGALNCAAARELLERHGKTAPEELAQLYPFIRARGWSHLIAHSTPAPTQVRRTRVADDIKIEVQPAGFEGFFRTKKIVAHTKTYAGLQADPITREAFVGYDAALVLPYDPKSDLIMMVEQLRFGALMREDPQPYMLEPIAGLVDAGEAPEAAARREAVEEAGITLDALMPIAQGYPAPGYVTEFHHMFLGLTKLDPSMAGQGGLEDESEDIRSHVMSFDDAMALVDSGEINATPLILMLLWLDRARSRLRGNASV